MTIGIPKPPPKLEKPRKGIPRKTAPKKRNPARRKSEFVRTYHSKARVEWVKGLPCEACWTLMIVEIPSVNAHTATGGFGRKANAETIVPLCRTHHNQLHRAGMKTFECIYGLDLRALAAETERKWQAVESLKPARRRVG